MVFYYPGVINKSNINRASKLRPYKFSQNLTRENDSFICGNSKHRFIQLISALRINKDDIFYIESNNMPFFSEDFRKFSLYPFLEIILLFVFKLKGYKIGFFYRDLFWRHSDFNYSSIKLIFKKGLYYVEWYFLKFLVRAFFLPNQRISELLPKNNKAIFQLYPGIDIKKIYAKKDHMQIEFLYVGGALPPFYNLSNLFILAQMMKNYTFHICVRKEEWDQINALYNPGENVVIHHIDSLGIQKLYDNSRIILVDTRESIGYVGYSIPYKYFEAIQFGAYIAKISGGVSDELLQNSVFGKSFKDLEEMRKFLELETKKTYDHKLDLINSNRDKHSWKSRVEEIRNNLNSC